MPIRNLLIANRGEIALRIMRTATALGYTTTAVYSDVDADAPHALCADCAVSLGSAALADSYLNATRIIEAARQAEADAVHPGYGMLSEAGHFARACTDAGLVFVGPSAENIELLADKAAARRAAVAAGVPCIPGYDGDAQDHETLQAEAARIGFPLMIKAAAGGGGRGMRRVEAEGELEDALARASAEAQAAFGDGRLLLEKLIEPARHVEIQVVADNHGHVVHLLERDCSVQRRFQKIIEEAPSPAVDDDLRARMGQAALSITRACDYRGVGTVELLLDAAGSFYFLEMNTRLQVEHGVTELITGLDLVELQLRIAEGEPLRLRQEDIAARGHAIEARVYAEDPAHGFLPQSGRVLRWEPPPGAVARVDHALRQGLHIGTRYDPMLAKVLAHGEHRSDALRRLGAALSETHVLGIRTNRDFLRAVLRHGEMQGGHADTSFLQRHGETCARSPAPSDEDLAVSALAYLIAGDPHPRAFGETTAWTNAFGLAWSMQLEHAGGIEALRIAAAPDAGFQVHIEARPAPLLLYFVQWDADSGRLRVVCNDVARSYVAAFEGDTLWLDGRDGVLQIRDRTYPRPSRSEQQGSGRIASPMDATVVQVEVSMGDEVDKGDVLLVLEAMKLQHVVRADVAGVVRDIAVRAGEHVDREAPLLTIEAGQADPPPA